MKSRPAPSLSSAGFLQPRQSGSKRCSVFFSTQRNVLWGLFSWVKELDRASVSFFLLALLDIHHPYLPSDKWLLQRKTHSSYIHTNPFCVGAHLAAQSQYLLIYHLSCPKNDDLTVPEGRALQLLYPALISSSSDSLPFKRIESQCSLLPLQRPLLYIWTQQSQLILQKSTKLFDQRNKDYRCVWSTHKIKENMKLYLAAPPKGTCSPALRTTALSELHS